VNILLNSFPKKIRIFDTTLRDGEQTPGIALKPEDKELIAKKLDEFGVDVIEAGMAITSPGEMDAIKRISKLGLNAEICSGCRCAIKDIEASLKCDVESIHLIVPTSELHQKYKLKKSKEEVIQLLIECVTYAKEHGLIVELSAEDGSRTDLEYLMRVFHEGIKAGADRVCMCDTVGIMTPERIYKLFNELRPKISKPLSVHCHNDFGMAVANSIAALRAGADQFHATVNGIGERAGNASLEEIVMSLKVLYGIDLGIKTEKIYELSRTVSKLTKIALPPNKAIVGDNAFTHESGIHTHGVLAMPLTYEPFEPELVGRKRRFVAGKHAGSHAVKVMLEEMGYTPNEEQFKLIFNEVKKLGDMGKRVTDSDLATIAENILGITSKKIVSLDELTVVTGNKITPTASVRIKINDKEYIESGLGVGPVDAAINAIEKALTGVTGIYLEKYEVEAISGGTDAIVDVSVQLRLGDRVVSARGASGDIVMASVEAVLLGMNKLLSMNNSKQYEASR
jgi:D-citramalate synthase